MRHEAGLPLFRPSIQLTDILTENLKQNVLGEKIAKMKPTWPENGKRQYHSMTRDRIYKQKKQQNKFLKLKNKKEKVCYLLALKLKKSIFGIILFFQYSYSPFLLNYSHWSWFEKVFLIKVVFTYFFIFCLKIQSQRMDCQ